MTQAQVEVPPIKIALVIDNQVVDIIHTDDRLAAILLSNPLIIDVTDNIDEDGNLVIMVNPPSTYNPETKQFTNPD
jgi:hypothetical protein